MTNGRYLVTGGAGFIGSHIVSRLVALGHEVRVVDNLSTGSRDNIDHVESDIEFLRGDLRNPDVCAQVVEGVDTVFHVAALPSVPRSLDDPISSHEHNVTATLNLLEAARGAGVRRVVYSSSSSVYGDTPTLPKREEMEIQPRSPYSVAKLAGEQYVLAYARAGLVEGVALRYFNIFGPRQSPHSAYAAVIPAFMQAALTGTPAMLYGDGQQTRDFTFVDNVVEANLLAAHADVDRVSGWAMNIGAGGTVSLLGLVKHIESISGRSLSVTHGDPRPGDVRDSMAAITRAQALLGYEPSVDLLTGLAHTWEWLHGCQPVEPLSGATEP